MALTVIKPTYRFSWAELRELLRYRELFFFLAWRDLKVRYRQTVLGILWVVLQPLLAMAIFSWLFGRLAGVPSGGAPYPVFVFLGLLCWQFFSTGLTTASESLVADRSIITKVYFPRIILPVAAMLTKFVDFSIATLVLIGLLAYYRIAPAWSNFLLLPYALAVMTLATVGLGLLLAAVNARYRDVRYVLPFFIQLLLFTTPVIYPASMLGQWSWLLALNPMTGVIETARVALLGSAEPDWPLPVISALAALALVVVGSWYFRRTERTLADIV